MSRADSFEYPQASIRNSPSQNFFVWREFLWGGLAGAFGEGMMHPMDTIKTRIQSQAVIRGRQNQTSIFQMVRTVWVADGLRGFYRGVLPGVTGSLATGATYFGVIESTKKWIEDIHPSLGGHWAHFIAGAIGDTLGSFVYVPCEVMKQRMQVQGSSKSWSSIMHKENIGQKCGGQMYGYYSGMLQAGLLIWKQHGLKGLYAGYWSTLARDVPFAGLMTTGSNGMSYPMEGFNKKHQGDILLVCCLWVQSPRAFFVKLPWVTFYEAFKEMTEYSQRWLLHTDNHLNNSFEGLLLGGLAGGLSAYLTTPLDVIKTRLQVQGLSIRYNGWSDAVHVIWKVEGVRGMFRGSVPRIIWYVPASAFTFMAVEFLRDHFNDKLDHDVHEVQALSIGSGSSMQEVARKGSPHL